MTKLENYLSDGADHQSRAVLMFLQGICIINDSWNDERKVYEAVIKVARWENCREQGYVVSLPSRYYREQLNIAFFEHRNSDAICAIKWEQTSLNSININTAKFNDIYKDKYDVSHRVSYGDVSGMAEWIINQLKEFWVNTNKSE